MTDHISSSTPLLRESLTESSEDSSSDLSPLLVSRDTRDVMEGAKPRDFPPLAHRGAPADTRAPSLGGREVRPDHSLTVDITRKHERILDDLPAAVSDKLDDRLADMDETGKRSVKSALHFSLFSLGKSDKESRLQIRTLLANFIGEGGSVEDAARAKSYLKTLTPEQMTALFGERDGMTLTDSKIASVAIKYIAEGGKAQDAKALMEVMSTLDAETLAGYHDAVMDGGSARQETVRLLAGLPLAQRMEFFEVDAASGRVFQGISLVEGKAHPEVSGAAKTIRGTVALVEAKARFDAADPSGKASTILADMVASMQEAGIPEPKIADFAEHLSFNQLMGNDAMPDPSVEGWEEDLRSNLMLRFQAQGNLTAEERLAVFEKESEEQQTLDLAKALHVRDEGSVHVLRMLRPRLEAWAATGTTEQKKFADVAMKLERNAYSTEKFIEKLKDGKDIGTIETELKADAQEVARELSERFNGAFDRFKDRLRSRIEILEDRAGLDQTTRDKHELEVLKAFIDEHGDETDFTPEQMGKLIDRFGMSSMSVISFPQPDPTNNSDFWTSLGGIEKFTQFTTNLDMIDNPEKLKESLSGFATVMPTAGKDLEAFHCIDSTVSELVSVATDIRTKDPTFSLEDNPIIIIDQSDGDGTSESRRALWEKNDAYLKGLEEKYEDLGLKIVHVSMRDVDRMLGESDVRKLFDTTGESMAGYGGARNLAFMLGPVIKATVKAGDGLDTITPDNIQSKIKAHALGADAPTILMGDDTDYMRPGAMFSKLGIVYNHQDEYFSCVSRRDGRDTTSVSPGYVKVHTSGDDPVGHMKRDAFANSGWDDKLRTPGMGTLLGKPRFCFDVPTGAEEGHHKAIFTYTDDFSRVSHLSGDRMGTLAGQVRGYFSYSASTAFFKGIAQGSSSPWNGVQNTARMEGEGGYSSLGDVFDAAKDPGSTRERQSLTLKNFAKQLMTSSEGIYDDLSGYGRRIDDYLAQHPELDPETREEFLGVKAAFEDFHAQSQAVRRYGDALLDQLMPGWKDVDFSDYGQETRFQELLQEKIERGMVDVGEAMKAARESLEEDGITLSQSENRIVRDALLVIESLAGGFSRLAGVVTA